jgi:pimeloyl-ACP methyl ester carboxylesterase
MSAANQNQEPPSTLVFIIHGLRGGAHTIADLKRLARESYPNSVVCNPTLPFSSLTSTHRAPNLVRDIIMMIDKEFTKTNFDRVVLIGHSMGAVLARRVLIEASGLPREWPNAAPSSTAALQVEPALQHIKERTWSHKVDLLILMASISRGWSVEHAQTGWQSFQWSLGGMIGHLLPKIVKPTLFDFRRGSPFIVQTRLRWLQYCKAKKEQRPKVFQFLGTVDEVAPPNDTIDFTTEDGGNKFAQIEIPNSGHSSIVDFYDDAPKDDQHKETLETRRTIVGAVLKGDEKTYDQYRVNRTFVLDELPPEPDPSIENVVFVVHGIRDRGYWTKKIAARVKEEAARAGTSFVSRTPSYGYFPILRFLLPWYRRQKTEWLMDHYVETAATYQNADFHYMGHSNGTYLCARALMDYPMASFKHIMFAGSVVHPAFEWKDHVEAGRVSKILNLVATADMVVAVFPNGLRYLRRLFDLGGAGHLGFNDRSMPDTLFQMDHGKNLEKVSRDYVQGGHSAARAEGLWDEIAQFMVQGKPPEIGQTHPLFKEKQSWIAKGLGIISPGLVAAIAFLVIALGVALIKNFAISIDLMQVPDVLCPIRAYILCLGPALNILLLGVYFVLLRFMALRF